MMVQEGGGDGTVPHNT